jgi:1-acyl-sn-glycerol-3-phosphate acyltransferase
MVRKSFHALLLDDSSLGHVPDDRPIVVFANHPGWWDPIAAMLLRKVCFANRVLYAPIDSLALENYGVLRKMGFYGLDLDSQRGAAQFLKTSSTIVSNPNSSLWITPEGSFRDVRDRTAPLMPGLAHLMHKHRQLVAIPLALEYPFWDERRPYFMTRLGSPIDAADLGPTKADCDAAILGSMRENQSHLESLVLQRAQSNFRTLIDGSGRSGGGYDFFRRCRSLLSGQKFQLDHTSQPKTKPPEP